MCFPDDTLFVLLRDDQFPARFPTLNRVEQRIGPVLVQASILDMPSRVLLRPLLDLVYEPQIAGIFYLLERADESLLINARECIWDVVL